ncbi:MAG: DNA-3-methyladenine glycosylase 2 family protein [Ruminococcaceae bacterium]|nr:DNA-3-methyladenine glycosylase 2 family protein [Oscillospiraceae bacterium]
MFSKKSELYRGRRATAVGGLGNYSLRDTLECGQAFRYERVIDEPDYVEYLTVAYGKIISVGQRQAGELIFFGEWSEEYEKILTSYFSLDTDYDKIRLDILSHTDSGWLSAAAESAKGVVILRQEPWETLFSFIVSQNNNIPRIRKIIRAICAEYGENLALSEGLLTCPLGKCDGAPSEEKCRGCGICFSFPTAEQILEKPEGLLPSHPGFRYKYLIDAAERVSSGEVSLSDIKDKASYDYTVEQLKRILGVGDKVASCVALFGFGNLEAFPIDVWMRRAIDEYFDGKLDPKALGSYAGVAQQYIFHYIRNLEGEEKK